MSYDELIKVAKDYAEKYLKQEKLGHDEELQLLSCGYSVLFLSACANKSPKELGLAHEFISNCFEKIGDKNYANRHQRTATGYSKM